MANETSYSVPLCRLDCIGADPHDYAYLREFPVKSYAITPVDVYGGLGFESVSIQGPDAENFCTLYAYCDGPTNDGVTSDFQWDRYETRWVAIFEAGEMFYGKVGDVIIPAPAALFPDKPFEGVTKISISFDANARPCFCMAYKSGLIEIRRFVAGEYVKYSFTGTSPVLIFNGILQHDLNLRDVVCYYSHGTSIWARFQRDNFATEYEIVTGIINHTIKITDRGRDELASFHILETQTNAKEKVLFYVDYPPWPVLQTDRPIALAVVNNDVDYSLVAIAIDESEFSTSNAIVNSDVAYTPFIYDLPPELELSTSIATILSDISYEQSVVPIAEDELSDSVVVINPDVHYYESTVPMSESSISTSIAVINSDIDYTT